MPDVIDDFKDTDSEEPVFAQGEDSEDSSEAEQPDYGPKFLGLPPNRIAQLQSLCNKLNLRDQYARQIEILRCALKRYFWLGLQHVWWNNDAASFQVGQLGGAVVAEDLNAESTAQQDFNIYKPNGKILTAVFSQNAATVRMEPDQPKESASIRAAQEAEKYLRVYDKYNPPQDAQITIGRLLWNDGRVLAITEACDDGPEPTEKTEYAGVLESKVPIYETCFELWPYCKVSKDHDVLAMKWKHPEVADKISIGGKAASPNDEIARMARVSTAEGITQLSHDTLQYLVTEDRFWLRPMAFMDMTEEDRAFWVGGEITDEDGEVQKKEAGVFPDGCKLTFCGETFCGAEACAMDDHLDVLHAEPGEGQARNSLGDPAVPDQMEFNDAMNLTAELLKYCVPSLWADIDETEFAAIREQLAQYGQIRPKKRKTGEPMENDFFPEPQIEAPAILVEWIQNLQGPLIQLLTGNQPAMFGANMEDQKTAKAYQQALQQSLGILTIIWVPYQRFAAKIHEQAAKIAAKRDDKFSALVDDTKKKGAQETIEIDPLVMRGGFSCSAVFEQGFPQSWSEKSQTWKGLKAAAATDPSIAATMNLPDNVASFHDAIGLPELVMEGADSRDKQLQEWADMQAGEGPEQDDEAMMQREQQRQQAATQAAATLAPGAQLPPLPNLPPIMKSSIPVDPDAEDHVAEALECFRILNSPEGLKVKGTLDLDAYKSGANNGPQAPNASKRTGLMVWQDLKLHMLAHIAAGKAKGLVFPPPLMGAPPPMPIPPKPGIPGAGASPLATPPPTTIPGGLNAATAA